jgi:hypothetical protein
MENFQIKSPVYDLLPDGLKQAQDAIHLPEVQEILKKLAKYNLGIAMPHKHNEETGAFEMLPLDEMQVEKGMQVSFVDREEALMSQNSLSVGWIWKDDGISASMACYSQCTANSSQTHGDGHISHHLKV